MKNTNSVKKILSAIFSVTFVICSIFLCSCTKYSKGKFCEENTEWVSDELTIETKGFHYVFGKQKTDYNEIEVLVDIFQPNRRGGIFLVSDFDDDFIREVKNDIETKITSIELNRKIRDYISEKGIKEAYLFTFDYKASPDRVEFKIEKDNYFETVGQESRVGETWVLTRKDLS